MIKPQATIRAGRFLCLMTLALLILGFGSSPAESPSDTAADSGIEGSQVLDMIVATVDDEVVLLSELLADLQLYVQQMGSMPSQTEQQSLLEEAFKSRIQEKMLIAKARRDEIQVGDEELELALDQHVGRLQEQAGGEERFKRQLEREGLSMRDLRKKLAEPMRENLLVQRILERVSFGIEVDSEEIRRFYEDNRTNPDIIPLRPRAVHLAHILVQSKPDAEREEALAARLSLARERLAAGEDFAAVARELSEGPAAERGGDLGWFRLADVALPELQFALANLPEGEIEDDIVSAQGYHIVKMEERDGTRVRFRQIFFSQLVTEVDQQRARERAREAWQRLNAGDGWEAIVTEYSDDKITAPDGGLLPLIAEEQMGDRYRSVVEALEPGEYSGVFLGDRGYQIVRLVERQESRPFLFEEIEEQIRTELMMRRQNAALDDYVATLEDEILVERKELPSLSEIAGLGEGP